MIRRVFVALSLAGVAVATILVLTRSGTPPGALFALPLTHHAAALATTLADMVLRGARFVILGTAMGVLIPISAATLAHIAADGAGAVIPARSGSDPAKALILSRRGVRGGHIGALLVGEAVSEAAVLPLCTAVLALALDVPFAAMTGPLAWSITSLTLVALAVRLAPSRDSRAPRLLARFRLSEERWTRIATVAADFREAAGALRRMSRVHLALLGLATVGHISARLLTLPVLVGPTATLANPEPFLAWPFFLLYGGSLIPAPGGGGLIEAGFAVTVGGHVPDDQLGSLAFWWRFYTFHLMAIAGWLVLVFSSWRGKGQANRGGPAHVNKNQRPGDLGMAINPTQDTRTS